MRTIMHVDMDAFFAAVEILDNPEYAGKPLIIGGPKDAKRGVVSTCSYEARRFGVHSAMSIQRAVALCPNGIYVRPRMWRYQELSEQIHRIFPEFSPVVEPLSIDEAFMDMTGCEHFYPSLEAMGQSLKKRIKEMTGLTASVGIAPNKFLAKLASDWKKPDGLMIISPNQVDDFLVDLPIGKLWGVGKQTERQLSQLKIYTVRDVREYPEKYLVEKLGSLGAHIYRLARGIDDRGVETAHDVKSIGQETTFDEDYSDLGFLRTQMAQLVEKTGWRLRKHDLHARTVSIKVRYGDFHTITRAHTTDSPIQDDDSIFNTAWDLFLKVPRQPVRLIGVYVSNLTDSRQLSLFDTTEKNRTVSRIMDKVNEKYKGGLRKGRTLPQDPSNK